MNGIREFIYSNFICENTTPYCPMILTCTSFTSLFPEVIYSINPEYPLITYNKTQHQQQDKCLQNYDGHQYLIFRLDSIHSTISRCHYKQQKTDVKYFTSVVGQVRWNLSWLPSHHVIFSESITQGINTTCCPIYSQSVAES